MAMPPNWFVSDFDEDKVMAEGLTEEQRIDAALAQVVKLPKVRNRVLDAIEARQKQDRDRDSGGPLICGVPSLAEMIRDGVSSVLVEKMD